MTHPTVTARGAAAVTARPDEGVWTLELAHLAPSTGEALDAVARRSQELSAILDGLGVEPANRSTSEVGVAEEFDYVEGRQVHRGFRAAVGLTVRVADPAVAAHLMEEAVTRVQAQVRGPSWVVALDNPARLEAASLAAAEARVKAAGYATALGLRLGAVIEVRDAETATAGPRPMGALRAVAYESSLEITPGELVVSAAVDVTFRLES